MSWKGSKAKVFTNSIGKYDELTAKYRSYFPSKSVLFMTAASVGMTMEGEPAELSENSKTELANNYSINKDGTLEILMEAKYPENTPEERLELLERYAERGIAVIYDQVKAKGRFDYDPYLK